MSVVTLKILTQIYITYPKFKTQTCKQEYASAGKVLVDKSFDLIHEPFHAICVVLRRNRPRGLLGGSIGGSCVYIRTVH